MPQRQTAAGAGHRSRVGRASGTVTFLFTDIEGSTALLQRAGDAYGSLLETHRRLLRAAFTAHGGREVDTQGDAFFVAFADPEQAVAAAAHAQRALADHDWPAECRVLVRIGLHSGAAKQVAGSYVGIAVHRGARIAAAAHGGQVLMSDATAALVRDHLPHGGKLRDLGEHRLKDFPAAARLFQLDLPGLSADFPPPRTLARRVRLPRLPGAFIGRENEMAAVTGLLRDHRTRLVTLSGPGGVGKTRLAVEAGLAASADLTGGAVFVPLTAVTDPALVIGAIADSLQVRREPGDDVVAAVAASLGDDRTLLVLDNFEQVLDAAGDIADLVDRVPAAVLLITSRHLLRLRSERQVAVQPLAETSAVQLFTERAAALGPDLPLDDQDTAVITEICRRLDGVPLAIELAAARTRLLGLQALLARLGERLDVLSGGPVDLPVRQRSLRATMDWSHDLLPSHEQAMFARLAVFAGGWDVDAAELVCGRTGEPDVLESLANLVDASLVAVSHADPEPRFSMLQTVRTYAAEQLAALPDRAETERRHGAWVVTLTEKLCRANGSEYRLATTRMDRERANLRSAVDRAISTGDTATAALVVRNTIGYMTQRDAQVEYATWLEQALRQVDDAEPAVRGRLFVLHAALLIAVGEAGASALLAEGEPLLPDGPDYEIDRAIAAVAAIQRGWELGPEQALQAVEEAAGRFRTLGMVVGEALMGQAAGDLWLALGEASKAADAYGVAVLMARTMGDDAFLGQSLSLLGLSQLAAGDTFAARRSVIEGAQANVRGGHQTSRAHSAEGLAGIALAEGRPVVAARALAAAAAARNRTALPLTPARPPLIAEMVDRCRALLGEGAFAEATAEGESWSLVQALDRTLQDLADPQSQGANLMARPRP